MLKSACHVCRAERVHRHKGPWAEAPGAQGSRTPLHQPNPPAQLRLGALRASQAQLADSARGLSQLEGTSRSSRSDAEYLPQLRGRSAASSAAASSSSRIPRSRQAGQRGRGPKQGVLDSATTITSAAAAKQRAAALLRQPSFEAVPHELVRQAAAKTMPVPMQPLQWPVLGASTAFQAPVMNASRAGAATVGSSSRATSLQHSGLAHGKLQDAAAQHCSSSRLMVLSVLAVLSGVPQGADDPEDNAPVVLQALEQPRIVSRQQSQARHVCRQQLQVKAEDGLSQTSTQPEQLAVAPAPFTPQQDQQEHAMFPESSEEATARQEVFALP